MNVFLSLMATLVFSFYALADNTELMDAIENNDLACVEKLLQDPDVIQIINEKEVSITPFYYATSMGNLAIAKELLKIESLDVNIADDRGETAIDISLEREYLDVTQMIVNHPTFDINAKGMYGRTPLIHASRLYGDNVDLVSYLLAQRGADIVDINKTDDMTHTALTSAAVAGNPLVMRALLQFRPKEINAAFQTGPGRRTHSKTPLMFAIGSHCFECVRALLDSGKDLGLDLVNDYGTTALQQAVASRQSDIVKLLKP